jgi:hypothetical protein
MCRSLKHSNCGSKHKHHAGADVIAGSMPAAVTMVRLYLTILVGDS